MKKEDFAVYNGDEFQGYFVNDEVLDDYAVEKGMANSDDQHTDESLEAFCAEIGAEKLINIQQDNDCWTGYEIIFKEEKPIITRESTWEYLTGETVETIETWEYSDELGRYEMTNLEEKETGEYIPYNEREYLAEEGYPVSTEEEWGEAVRKVIAEITEKNEADYIRDGAVDIPELETEKEKPVVKKWNITRQYGNTVYERGNYKVQKNNDNTAWEALSLFSPGTYQKLRGNFPTAKKAKEYCEERIVAHED